MHSSVQAYPHLTKANRLYILLVSIFPKETQMKPASVKTSVFMNGGSQAVRIPKAFRFNTTEVFVSPCNGGLFLRPAKGGDSVDELFAQCDTLGDDEKGFLDVRPCNSFPKSRELFA